MKVTKENTPLLQASENDNSPAASVDQASGCSGEPTPEAPRPEAGASNNQPTPGCSGGSSTSAPLAATNHHQSNSTVNQTFARYLILSHSDRSKDITKINPYAIEKAMSVLIAGHFTITRYERTKLIEVYVRSKRQSETLVAATELDCTEFKIPITVTKHRTKNTSKGVVHCDFFANTPKSKLLADMAADKVIDIYRFKETKNGVEIPKDSYCLTFDSEVPPKEMLMGYILIKVSRYYPNPRLCRNCQRYGHGDNFCRNKQICAKCGIEGHSFRDCESDSSCCHCKENHSASTKTCPMWILEKRILKVIADERCTYPEARKKVYRDSHDLVAKVPSLSGHIVQSWSNVVATNQTNSRAQQSVPRPQTQTPSIDIFDNPSFKALQAQQESTKALLDQIQQQQAAQQKTTTDLLAQMQQQQEAQQQKTNDLLAHMQKQQDAQQQKTDDFMVLMKNMFMFLVQQTTPPSAHHNYEKLLQLGPSLSTSSNTSNTSTQSSEIQPMEAFSSSSKRLHSDSSEGGEGAEQIKKLATSSSVSSVRHEESAPASVFQDKVEQPGAVSISAPVPQDKGAQAEQPKTDSSTPASVPKNTVAQTGQSKSSTDSKIPVHLKLGKQKSDGQDKPPVPKKPGERRTKPSVPPEGSLRTKITYDKN